MQPTPTSIMARLCIKLKRFDGSCCTKLAHRHPAGAPPPPPGQRLSRLVHSSLRRTRGTRRTQRGYALGPAMAVLAWLGLVLLAITLIGHALDRDYQQSQYRQEQRQRLLSGRDAR